MREKQARSRTVSNCAGSCFCQYANYLVSFPSNWNILALYNFYEIIILLCDFTISEEKNFDETLRFTYTYMQITLHRQEINTRKIK